MATSVTSLSTDGGITKKSNSVVFVSAGSGLNFTTASANAFALNAVPNTVQTISDKTTTSNGVITFGSGTGVDVVGGAGAMDFSASGGTTETPYEIILSTNPITITSVNQPFSFGQFSLLDVLPASVLPSTSYLLYYELTVIYNTDVFSGNPRTFTSGLLYNDTNNIIVDTNQYFPGYDYPDPNVFTSVYSPGIGCPNLITPSIARDITVSGTGYFTITTPASVGVGTTWDMVDVFAQASYIYQSEAKASFQSGYVYCIGATPTPIPP